MSHCGREPDEKGCYVNELLLTERETTVLAIARQYFLSFAQPESQAWMAAVATAETEFGVEAGARIAARILGMVQAIRRARSSVFMYNSADCPGCATIATEQERRMMTALAALSRGSESRAQLELMLLCEGNQLDDTIAAMRRLSGAISGHATASQPRSQMSSTLLQ